VRRPAPAATSSNRKLFLVVKRSARPYKNAIENRFA
jgi:hypothetical protein